IGINMKLLAVCFVIFASTEFGLSHPADEAVADAQKEGVKLWALLVAGSNGYYNYRHQADICHAYQIMKKHGIPDERIVVMMYDDIANSVHNPMRGKIINEPNGNDVYHGVLKDYTEEHVNPKNFLNVLQGNKEAVKGKGSGKVINSGPNDHVFVNFADHGAPNILAFPSEELNKRDLHNAIINMHKEKKYGKMVFYVEACESGSMFSNSLPNNINVFATTAANGQESSYACYWDAKLETYLGDVYSIKWMEDSDKEDIEQETLQQQYNIVKSETNTSHVQVFGDPKVGSMKVGEFQGLKRVGKSSERSSDYLMDAVDSRDVQLFILANKIKGTKS
ncbi:LGMN (predicted), partial [Pycnogonum litorale]